MKKTYNDPGHGGNDPGAVDGKSGDDVLYTEEEDVNLGISLYMHTALVRCGVADKMSRTTDVYPSLADRYNGANNYGADACVSNHANACGTESVQGIEIIFYPGSVQGQKLGEAIMKRISPISPWADRTVRKDTRGLAMVSKTKMPAVIIEYGFLTNTAEERLLASKTYQKQLGEAAAHGICDYLGVAWVPTTTTDEETVEDSYRYGSGWAETPLDRSKVEDICAALSVRCETDGPAFTFHAELAKCKQIEAVIDAAPGLHRFHAMTVTQGSVSMMGVAGERVEWLEAHEVDGVAIKALAEQIIGLV